MRVCLSLFVVLCVLVCEHVCTELVHFQSAETGKFSQQTGTTEPNTEKKEKKKIRTFMRQAPENRHGNNAGETKTMVLFICYADQTKG